MKDIVTHRLFLLLPVIWLLLSEPLLPQTVAPRSANHAFATQMGSGIYTSEESVMQIYRINTSVGLRSPLVHRWGLRLRLPLTVGFYDYEVMEFFSSGLPEDLTTLAFLPSLELEHYATHYWLVTPFAGFGAGINWQQHSHDWITTIGLRNLFVFPWREWEIRLNQRILYSELLTPALAEVDDFSMFESGVDFRHALGFTLFGLELDGGIFGINYVYKTSPHLLVSSANPFRQEVEWEFGVTTGTVRPAYFWRFIIPRVGLSYRFGNDRSSIRIIVGDAFPILSPRE